MKVWRTVQGGSHLSRRRYFCASLPRHRQEHQSVRSRLSRGEDASNSCVEGWVRSVRKQKRIAFAAIGDGSSLDPLQAVLEPEDALKLSYGTAVKLTGDWTRSTGSKQSHELRVSKVDVLGQNEAETNPLQPKYQTAEYLRTIPHLRARIPSNAVLLRLRSQLTACLTNFFNDHDFVQCHTPIITSSDCEGAGEVFTISANTARDVDPASNAASKQPGEHFFRTPKYLTVSAQLHLEALAQAVKNVWTLSPTFRAEKSDTPRHLSEFYMLEAELCFVEDLSDIMDQVEDMLRSAVTNLKKSSVWSDLLKAKQHATKEDQEADEKFVSANALERRWDGIIAPDWPRITYAEAIEKLERAHSTNEACFIFPPTYDAGLQAEHERYIASIVGQGRPVFVTDYPRTQKPFYMPPSSPKSVADGSPQTVACFDLLVPDLCELVGGSLREHRSQELLEAMEAKGVAGNDLEWYHDLRRFGSVPHGGFGLGFDRLLCYLSGIGNVRDVVAFPRWYSRCDC